MEDYVNRWCGDEFSHILHILNSHKGDKNHQGRIQGTNIYLYVNASGQINNVDTDEIFDVDNYVMNSKLDYVRKFNKTEVSIQTAMEALHSKQNDICVFINGRLSEFYDKTSGCGKTNHAECICSINSYGLVRKLMDGEWYLVSDAY